MNPGASAAGPYRLFTLLDSESGQIPVFVMKVPADWTAQQSFRRHWTGATAQNVINIRLTSPDGRAQIDFLPSAHYMFAEGPMAENLRAQKMSMGMPPMGMNERPPMRPVAYIQQMMMGFLHQNGMGLSQVGNAQEEQDTHPSPGTWLSCGSVDGLLPNGRRARVECRITVKVQQQGVDRFFDWSVVPSVIQTETDLEAVHRHVRVAQHSLVFNPAWLRMEQEMQSRGQQMNMEAQRQQNAAFEQSMMRGHEQRMADIRNFGEANTAQFNDRTAQMDQDMAAFQGRTADMDRQQRIRVDGIREEARYEDPRTGERVRVAEGHQHVYRSNADGNVYLATDAPIEANRLDWQELRRVELRNY